MDAKAKQANGEFITLFNELGKILGENLAIMGYGGAPVILKYRGEDLPWRVPVHIDPADWEILMAAIRTDGDCEFWLTVDEGLYLLLQEEYRAPQVHLVRSSPDHAWFVVVDHGYTHVVREFEQRFPAYRKA